MFEGNIENNLENLEEDNFKLISNMFCKKLPGFTKNDLLSIGEYTPVSLDSGSLNRKTLTVRFIKYVNETLKSENDQYLGTCLHVIEDLNKNIPESQLGVEIQFEKISTVIS